MKKTACILLSVLVLLGALPMAGHAVEIVDSGTCGAEGDGSNLTWTLDSDGLLTISGSGAMRNYAQGSSPWFWNISVKKVIIKSGATSIGDTAFWACEELMEVTIPDSVTSIGDGAFSSCMELSVITVGEENPVYYSKDNCVIHKESKTLVFGCKNSIIPTDDKVTIIGNGAFLGCNRLTLVTIPNSVTHIGDEAFGGCGLTKATIPDSVTSIGDLAFSGCWKITEVTIPETVTSIGYGAFSCGEGLTKITVEAGNPVYFSKDNCLIHKESKTLIAGCKNSIIPTDGSVTSIKEWAFSQCTGLSQITIPDTVKRIGKWAFMCCTELTSITIPVNVTSIEWQAFSQCTGLTEVKIGNRVTRIEGLAFYGCIGLSSVTIPDSVTKIDKSAFDGCTSLSSVIIPASVTIIGIDAIPEQTVIYGYAASYAQQWAKENGRIFRLIEELPGDPDADGQITSADARLALRSSVKLENYAEGSAQFLAADYDKNGKIESADARAILRVSVSLDPFA